MKTILSGLVAGLVLGAGSLFAVADASAETTLRITLQLPITHPLGRNLEAFEQEVEAGTDGEVQVEIYPAAQLYKDSEVPQAVGTGSIEMGVASLTRFAGTIPAVDIFYVPFTFRDQATVFKATDLGSPVRGPIDDAIEGTGAKVLWWMEYGGAIMLSKDEPLPTPADVEGKKVRVFGKTLGTFIEAVGGSPALISGSEQFLAYQRGVVDAGMTGVTGVQSRKLDQVMDWVTVTNHAAIQFIVLINVDTWNELTADQQSVVQAAAAKAQQALRDEIAEDEAEAYAYAEERGMGVRVLTDAEREAWVSATSSVVDSYIEDAGPLGAQLVEAARSLN